MYIIQILLTRILKYLKLNIDLYKKTSKPILIRQITNMPKESVYRFIQQIKNDHPQAISRDGFVISFVHYTDKLHLSIQLARLNENPYTIVLNMISVICLRHSVLQALFFNLYFRISLAWYMVLLVNDLYVLERR